MHEAPLQIFVDDREFRSRVAGFLEAAEDARVIRKRLKVGDYLIEGRLLVERKRIPDFLTSLCDGRLFRQAAALAASGLRALVILEGTSADWHHSKLRREAIQGALLTLGVIFGLQILRAQDEGETARIILFAARQLRQGAHTATRRPGWRPKGKRARQLYILTSLPHVGATRAKALLDDFGTVERVCSASETELLAVSGVGPRTVAAIQWAVRETVVPYRADDPGESEENFPG
jgi:ERCC4-type nuclease